ncbi:unnamed protein product [Moneuplotes crassus]|uniref:Uncharacterized protein n=1 Tax=Euplotes crassus TaxID=5936 RepID=A0AAD2D8S2_EUPCR|nr:unnamed protein product [Moneuplotes crassus]
MSFSANGSSASGYSVAEAFLESYKMLVEQERKEYLDIQRSQEGYLEQEQRLRAIFRGWRLVVERVKRHRDKRNNAYKKHRSFLKLILKTWKSIAQKNKSKTHYRTQDHIPDPKYIFKPLYLDSQPQKQSKPKNYSTHTPYP